MRASTPWSTTLLAALAIASACTPAPSAGPVPGKPLAPAGARDSKDFFLAKNDPFSGDRFSARVTKDPARGWIIVSSSVSGESLPDRLARGGFLEHLLEAAGQLVALEKAPHGPAASLGLDPPRFALRWKEPEGKERELRIGDAAPGADGVYARIDDEAPWIARGSLVALLASIRSFADIRLPNVSTWDEDRIDEIEIQRGTGTVRYAQREGDGWADKKEKPVQPGLAALPEKIAGLRITRYVDDPTETLAISKKLERPEFKVLARDRKSAGLAFRIARSSGKLYASVSSREGAVFEISADTLAWLSAAAR